jgi:hypothetical protein
MNPVIWTLVSGMRAEASQSLQASQGFSRLLKASQGFSRLLNLTSAGAAKLQCSSYL